jgi:hypothetical protein
MTFRGVGVSPAILRCACGSETAGEAPAPRKDGGLVQEENHRPEKIEPALLSGVSTPSQKSRFMNLLENSQVTAVPVDADNSASPGR